MPVPSGEHTPAYLMGSGQTNGTAVSIQQWDREGLAIVGTVLVSDKHCILVILQDGYMFYQGPTWPSVDRPSASNGILSF